MVVLVCGVWGGGGGGCGVLGGLSLGVGGRVTSAIDHTKNTCFGTAKHQVMEDAAWVVEQHAVALAAWRQADDIDGHLLLKSLGRLRAVEQ